MQLVGTEELELVTGGGHWRGPLSFSSVGALNLAIVIAPQINVNIGGNNVIQGGSITLAGPARAGPAVVVLLVLLVVGRRRRSPYLARPVDPPPDPERTVRGRDGHRRRAPPGGVVPP